MATYAVICPLLASLHDKARTGRSKITFCPICLMTYQSMNANPIGLVLCVSAASLTAFLTPMATSTVPVCMSVGGYDLKPLFKSGWLISILISVVYIFYIMTLYPAF